MRYLLSKIFPVFMTSTYRVQRNAEPPMGVLADSTPTTPRAAAEQRVTTTWWQWRDRVWAVRTVPA